MSEELAKILVRHVADGEEHIETPWAKRVGPNLYELDNLLWYAYGISCGDVLEAIPQEEGGFPEVLRVVRKSGHRTIRLMLDLPVPEGQTSTPLLDLLVSLGCSYEGMYGRLISIDVPPNVDLTNVCESVSQAGLQWEHADPTYEQLYPAG